jgi:hypothetical protein
MCGRFTAGFEFREIKLLFNLQRDLPSFAPRYNIAPMEAHDVSPLINKPEYDRADCINPVADRQVRLV